ncbi:MAG: PepSY domain-containing protein [Stellaceae bacterium]
MRIGRLTLAAMLACATSAWAGPPPPAGAKPLSEILGQIERTPDFRYIGEAELEHGLYKIEYSSKDGVKHKVYIDPMTGTVR